MLSYGTVLYGARMRPNAYSEFTQAVLQAKFGNPYHNQAIYKPMAEQMF